MKPRLKLLLVVVVVSIGTYATLKIYEQRTQTLDQRKSEQWMSSKLDTDIARLRPRLSRDEVIEMVQKYVADKKMDESHHYLPPTLSIWGNPDKTITWHAFFLPKGEGPFMVGDHFAITVNDGTDKIIFYGGM